MNDKTCFAVTVFEKADWFSRVGVKDGEAAEMLSSWPEAMRYCESVEMQNFGLYASQRLQGQILARARLGHDEWNPALTKLVYDKWNGVVRGLKPAVTKLVKEKIEKVVQENHLRRKPFEEWVYGDILCACVELEYSEVIKPGFFGSIAYWYVKGHFPCGGKGVEYRRPKMVDGKKRDGIDLYPPGFYDPIAKWYETGDFGDWQGQIPPPGKLIVY